MSWVEYMKGFFNNSSFYYVIIANMEGRYAYVNDNYKRSFSYKDDEIVGQPYQITMHPDDANICEEVSAKCFANPNNLYPATIRKHDGKGGYVITQWEYKAIFTSSGEPDGIFCVGYDITKYMEEQQLLISAENEIARQKLTLDNIAFQHAHLIRAPLSNIMGLAAVLNNMELDANLKTIISLIIESSAKLDAVIRDVVLKSYQPSS